MNHNSRSFASIRGFLLHRFALGRARTCRRGSVLVGLLWCLAILSVVVIGVLHTARMDLIVVKNYGDRIQAHYLALAGIEKVKALMYQDIRARMRSARHHSGELYNAPEQFREVRFGRGQFTVFRRGREDEGGGIVYGISDEESRLNVNVASAEELTKLDVLTPDVIAAIIDWRDADSQVTPAGAEIDYYASLRPPSQPRNGPFQTVRELLMVRGVSRELLLGPNFGPNGAMFEPSGNPTSGTLGTMDLGLAGMLTVDSAVKELTAAGTERVNVQQADERALTGIPGITPEIARAIIAYRGQHELKSIADLLDVTAPRNQNQFGPGRGNRGRGESSAPQPEEQSSSDSQSTSSGSKVISEQLLTEIGDDVTAQTDEQMKGPVNINTASAEVLSCLPGIQPDLAQTIISYRKSNGYFPNTACLLNVPGMTRDIFKRVLPRVSVRSETFRILCEGRVASSGTRQRIQEIVRITLDGLTTLSYREDDL